jgi:hypothetical protein
MSELEYDIEEVEADDVFTNTPFLFAGISVEDSHQAYSYRAVAPFIIVGGQVLLRDVPHEYEVYAFTSDADTILTNPDFFSLVPLGDGEKQASLNSRVLVTGEELAQRLDDAGIWHDIRTDRFTQHGDIRWAITTQDQIQSEREGFGASAVSNLLEVLQEAEDTENAIINSLIRFHEVFSPTVDWGIIGAVCTKHPHAGSYEYYKSVAELEGVPAETFDNLTKTVLDTL